MLEISSVLLRALTRTQGRFCHIFYMGEQRRSCLFVFSYIQRLLIPTQREASLTSGSGTAGSQHEPVFLDGQHGCTHWFGSKQGRQLPSIAASQHCGQHPSKRVIERFVNYLPPSFCASCETAHKNHLCCISSPSQ